MIIHRESISRESKGSTSLYGKHYYGGHVIDIYGYDDEKEQIVYNVDNGRERRAKGHYVCGFGGNPFPGTIVSWYSIVIGSHRIKWNIFA